VKRWVPRTGRQVALTIDDGPATPYTAQVLDVLEQFGVVATFCMVGRQVSGRPDLARMVAERGHLLANHTWGHADLTRLSASRLGDEIDRAQDIIHRSTGRAPTFFRAPYGAWSGRVTEACATRGLRPLGWSVDPQDWARPSVPVLVSRLLRDTTPGSILLEHDGGGDRSQTVAALKVVLPRLLEEGYRFVTP
jgi:peptidoglycan-N-acetylglucosamine deacetylase